MFSQFVDKITFLLDNNLETITLVISLILGSPIAISNALHPVSIQTIPISPFSATAIALFGSLIRASILGLITILLCQTISKTNYVHRLKIRFNNYFFTKFNQTPYKLFNGYHSSVLILFLSTLPLLYPVVSLSIGFSLRLNTGKNIYINLIGLLLSNMLLTLYFYFSDLRKKQQVR